MKNLFCFAAAAMLSFTAHAGNTILGSKHDLSARGPGPVKAATETEICVFCHTPHRALDEMPLWNHALSSASYTPYSSSTMKAPVGQPTGASKLCLSCHDGTTALGMVNSRRKVIEMQGGVVTMPPGRSNMRIDLSDDHPISFSYNSALARGEMKDPAMLKDRVRLDARGDVQCTSCHNPHNDQFGKFLVQSNKGGALCASCHSLKQWEASSHRTSARTWSGAGRNPWPLSEEKTVADNACGNCHASHGSNSKNRLLTYGGEEQSCYVCHGGSVASKDIQTEFNKSSVHPVELTSMVHDPAEDLVNPKRHVECVDCHNPHASRKAGGAADDASRLAGVRGISAGGAAVEQVSHEYELCFRCHGDSAKRGASGVSRQRPETNTRLVFAPTASSYHPVLAAGRNPLVPSLISPLTRASRIRCTDCHNSDSGPGAGGTGPNGPHGSVYAPLLERQCETTDYTVESSAAYALCYKCHSRDSILANESFPLHRKHIVDVQAACTTCHDSHGVLKATHLINFNRTYVTPASDGRLEFLDQGTQKGSCSLRCHGADHAPRSY